MLRKIRHFYILTISFVLMVYSSCSPSLQNVKNNPAAIMAYYVPSENKSVDNLPLDKLTHVIFSFTEIEENRMLFKNKNLHSELKALVNQADRYPDLKVMIACGGWGGSGGFSDMALTKENRSLFINSVLEFIKEYNLDGIDLDWEYPGLPGIGNTHRPEDKENFTALVSELRKALNEINPDLILTFAAAGWERYFEHIELLEVMKQVDYINIMTYDLASLPDKTSHHTALYNSSDSIPSLRYGHRIVQFCIEKGVNPQKIVLGAAFYGRSWSGVYPDQNGLHQPYTGIRDAHSFTALQKILNEDSSYKRHWDTIAKAPFIYNPIDSIFITYENPESLKEKSEYVKEYQLGGIMFWQLSHDTEGYILTNTLFEQFQNN